MPGQRARKVLDYYKLEWRAHSKRKNTKNQGPALTSRTCQVPIDHIAFIKDKMLEIDKFDESAVEEEVVKILTDVELTEKLQVSPTQVDSMNSQGGVSMGMVDFSVTETEPDGVVKGVAKKIIETVEKMLKK